MGLIQKIANAISIDELTDQELAEELSGSESLAQIPRELLPAIREKAFTRLADAVLEATPEPIAGVIRGWAAAMTERSGPIVPVWSCVLPWHAALLVVDRGEAPVHWPPAFTEYHVERAKAWFTGLKVPFAVSGKGPGIAGSLK